MEEGEKNERADEMRTTLREGRFPDECVVTTISGRPGKEVELYKGGAGLALARIAGS